MHTLEQSNTEKVSTKERYQRKVHQLETERHALRQTLKMKATQVRNIFCNKVASLELN